MDGWLVGVVGWLGPKIFVSAPGILLLVHQEVRLMMFLLKMVDSCCPPGGGFGSLQDFSVSPSPLLFFFGFIGIGDLRDRD